MQLGLTTHDLVLHVLAKTLKCCSNVPHFMLECHTVNIHNYCVQLLKHFPLPLRFIPHSQLKRVSFISTDKSTCTELFKSLAAALISFLLNSNKSSFHCSLPANHFTENKNENSIYKLIPRHFFCHEAFHPPTLLCDHERTEES